jgi:hypothetical protein
MDGVSDEIKKKWNDPISLFNRTAFICPRMEKKLTFSFSNARRRHYFRALPKKK